jgi:hypothetical protein
MVIESKYPKFSAVSEAARDSCHLYLGLSYETIKKLYFTVEFD